jgi:hypothetical protein
MTAAFDLRNLLVQQLTDAETAWSMGTFGAIAEFTRGAEETAVLDCDADAVWAVTKRGGIRIETHEAVRPIASESLTAQSWNQRVALCLQQADCAMARRSMLSEIGPDSEALRAGDRTAVLFDLGLGALQLDGCVRTDNPVLVAELRRWVGQSLFLSGNGAMAAILAAKPHRVFLSRLGRLEVYQPIPPPDGKSPEGPHTHILPKLLRHKRTHTATEALPAGWIPCAHFYPPHPMRNAHGEPPPFHLGRHAGFQTLLSRYGAAQLVDLKSRVLAGVAAGNAPSSIDIPADRFARAAVRVALRQLRAADPAAQALPAWLSAHDRSDPDEPNDAAGDHPCTA